MEQRTSPYHGPQFWRALLVDALPVQWSQGPKPSPYPRWGKSASRKALILRDDVIRPPRKPVWPWQS